jgi:hypothetical protein
MKTFCALKLPHALDALVINVYSEIGTVKISQTEPKFIDGKWVIDVYLRAPDCHLRLRGPDDRPGA